MQLDYAAIMRGGQSLVPDLRQQLIEDALLKQQNTVFQQQQEDRAAQIEAARQAQAKEGEFQQALDAAMMSGNPQDIQRLRFRFPEFTKGMKDAFDAMDEDMRRTNLTQVGSIYANLNAGNTGRAVELLRGRIEADRAAGQVDEQDEAILAELESGDPMRVNAAKATVGIMLAAIEPDKFGETYGKLNPTEATPATIREYDARVAKFGKAAADSWLATQDTKLIAGAPGGQVLAYGPNGTQTIGQDGQPQGGGDPSGSGASIPATGAAIQQAALAAVPGAIVTSGKRSPAKNKAVGGVANSYHLSDQARDFVPPKGMSMGQLASQLKAAMPGFDVINEGDHVHVEPAGGRTANVQASGFREGQTATNPRTGERIVFRNGAWRPL